MSNVALKIGHDEDHEYSEKLMELSLDHVKILIPQHDITTFESVYDINTQEATNKSVGWINFQGVEVPVYCLAADLDISHHLLTNRSICVLLEDTGIALLCSEIGIYSGLVTDIQPLPDCMTASNTPIEGFCITRVNTQMDIKLYVTGASLKKYIEA